MNRRETSPLVGLAGSECLRTLTDNLLRTVVVFLLIARFETEAEVQATAALVNVSYAVPWVLLSILAGALADRVSKRTVLLGLKFAEIGVMALAVFALPSGSTTLLLGCVALVGTVGALASPCKYGLVPELVATPRLSSGMGTILLWTYVAIPAGVAAGGGLLDLFREARWAVGLILLGIAVAGLVFTWRIPRVPAARQEGGLGATLRGGWTALTTNARLRMGFLGDIGYWALAAFLSQTIVVYSKTVLGLTDTDKAFVLATIMLGIGIGAALAGRLSRDRFVPAFLPFGIAAMGLVTLLFGVIEPRLAGVVALCLSLGIGAGFFLVTINALIQAESPPGLRGAVIAVNNVVVFFGIGVGSLAAWGLARAGLSSPQIMLVSAGVTALGAVYAFWRVPRVLGPS